MSLDPVFTRQFGWADAYDLGTIMTDPVLAARAGSSYRDDLEYTPPAIAAREFQIDGPLGTGTLRVRVYTPTEGSTNHRAALVWAHGGGFLSGDLDMQEADGVAREVSDRGSVVVISVDYHLADGTIAYPIPHREVAATIRWVTDNSASLGIDSSRIGVGGASAGANLALAATLELRDRGEALPHALVLAYPLLHDVIPDAVEPADLSSVPQLLRISQGLVSMMFTTYLGANATDAQYATVAGHEVAGLPTSLVIAAEFDDLRGSAEAFVDQASAAGVNVTIHLAEGAGHGFLNMSPHVAQTKTSLDLIAAFVG